MGARLHLLAVLLLPLVVSTAIRLSSGPEQLTDGPRPESDKKAVASERGKKVAASERGKKVAASESRKKAPASETAARESKQAARPAEQPQLKNQKANGRPHAGPAALERQATRRAARPQLEKQKANERPRAGPAIRDRQAARKAKRQQQQQQSEGQKAPAQAHPGPARKEARKAVHEKRAAAKAPATGHGKPTARPPSRTSGEEGMAPGAKEKIEEVNRMIAEGLRSKTGTSKKGGIPHSHQARVVTVEGTKDDPFEQAYHWDDWAGGASRKFLNLSSPLCIRDVGQKGLTCKLLSQRLCDKKSKGPESLSGGFAQCMARRRSCAVVGSSSHLLNASLGQFVDSHDFVIRINAAPDGTDQSQFAKYVGSKTDARFTNMFGHMPETDAAATRKLCIFVHEPWLPKACGNVCWRNPGLCNVTCGPQTATSFCTRGKCSLDELQCRGQSMPEENRWGDSYVFLDNFFGGISDQVVPHSTAGFKAVIYAMSMCQKVSIVGFGPTCAGAIGTKYYPSSYGVHTWHHYNEELMLLSRAEDLGTNAIMPPDARQWIKAKQVEVSVPSCVPSDWRDSALKLFERVGAGSMVNLMRVAHSTSEGGAIAVAD